MEKSQESWKKYWPWIIAAIGFIIIVIVIIFALKGSGSGSGGGTGSNPPTAKLGVPTLKKADPAFQPWGIVTKYAVAYIDTNGSAATGDPVKDNTIHDGTKDYCASLHGPLSNVVAVQSQTDTSPTFALTRIAGYDILVFRTQGATSEDPPDSVSAPVGAFASPSCTVTPGKSSEKIIQVISSKSPADSFTDNDNPYNGPPTVQNLDYKSMQQDDKKKIPFRNQTFYKIILSLSATDGSPAFSTTPAIDPAKYNALVQFDGTLDGQNYVGGYTIKVFSSPTQGASGTWRPLNPFFTQATPSTITFTDSENIQYTGPPGIDTLAISYVADPASPANPWGYLTSYLAALSDYPDPAASPAWGASPAAAVSTQYQPLGNTYPMLTFTTVPPKNILDGYYVILFRTDNHPTAAPTGPLPSPPPVSATMPFIVPYANYTWSSSANTISELPISNPYEGVAIANYSSPAWAPSDLNTLPFKTPITIQTTLADLNNKFSSPVTSSLSFSNPTSSIPTISLTLSNKTQFWSQYVIDITKISVADFKLTYTASAAAIPYTNSNVVFTLSGQTLAIQVNLNPYVVTPYGTIVCKKLINGGDCDDICTPGCSDTQCCQGNTCVTIPAGVMKNKNGSCSGTQISNKSYTDLAGICTTGEKSYNNLFLLNNSITRNKTTPATQTYGGYCVSDCPTNWTLGNFFKANDPNSKNVCSPLDAGTSNSCPGGGGDKDINCLGIGCFTQLTELLPHCLANNPPTAINPGPWIPGQPSCGSTYPLAIPFHYDTDSFVPPSGDASADPADLIVDYNICTSWQ